MSWKGDISMSQRAHLLTKKMLPHCAKVCLALLPVNVFSPECPIKEPPVKILSRATGSIKLVWREDLRPHLSESESSLL